MATLPVATIYEKENLQMPRCFLQKLNLFLEKGLNLIYCVTPPPSPSFLRRHRKIKRMIIIHEGNWLAVGQSMNYKWK